MTTVALPLSACIKLIGPVLIAWMIALILISQIDWSWRIAAALTILLLGTWTWWLFLKRRPVNLTIGAGHNISCARSDGRIMDVSAVLPGVIHPGLVCARLRVGRREYCDLFVPGGTLPEDTHRQLRCALIGFRLDQSDARRGT